MWINCPGMRSQVVKSSAEALVSVPTSPVTSRSRSPVAPRRPAYSSVAFSSEGTAASAVREVATVMLVAVGTPFTTCSPLLAASGKPRV